jgi:hypothetical protein
LMPNAFFVGFASAIRVCAELNAKISLLVSYRPLAVELRILGRLQHTLSRRRRRRLPAQRPDSRI